MYIVGLKNKETQEILSYLSNRADGNVEEAI